MDKKDFYKKISGYTEENFIFDDPHFSKRCEEYDLSKEWIIDGVIKRKWYVRILNQDRPKVYKVYFELSKHKLLKLIIDFEIHNKIRLRTIRIISERKSDQLAKVEKQLRKSRF